MNQQNSNQINDLIQPQTSPDSTTPDPENVNLLSSNDLMGMYFNSINNGQQIILAAEITNNCQNDLISGFSDQN
jgi:hypothetical protein